jgi:hypothetical protein
MTTDVFALLAELGIPLDDPTPKRQECMYCGVVMSPGAEPVSHGVCRDCRSTPATVRRVSFFSPEG